MMALGAFFLGLEEQKIEGEKEEMLKQIQDRTGGITSVEHV